ncbi:MAG: hypothetical protein HY650_07220 [Acidobacteria bacterium]|nr:hypothetical protein [Acidobacteriota bacterium]
MKKIQRTSAMELTVRFIASLALMHIPCLHAAGQDRATSRPLSRLETPAKVVEGSQENLAKLPDQTTAGSGNRTEVFIPVGQPHETATAWLGAPVMWIHNLGSTPANIQFYLFKLNQPNTSPAVFNDALPAGKMRRYDDPVRMMFGENASGVLRIVSDREVLVRAGIDADPSDRMATNSLQRISAAVPSSFSIGAGQKTALLDGLQVTGLPFGIVETIGGTAQIRITARDAAGIPVASSDYDLSACEPRGVEFEGLTAGHEGTGSSVEIEVLSGAGRVIAFGTGLPRTPAEGPEKGVGDQEPSAAGDLNASRPPSGNPDSKQADLAEKVQQGGELTGNGTIGKIPRWTGSRALGDSSINETDGNVHIGPRPATTNARLWVTGEGANSAIVGSSDGTDGAGVTGFSIPGGTGVSGNTTKGTGVAGDSAEGEGVKGASVSGSGVRGESMSATGVLGMSMTGAGVRGESESGRGVHGSSKTLTGVLGESEGGPGVAGRSMGGGATFGVLGRAEGGSIAGVHGVGTAEADGVQGRAEGGGIGVKGESASGTGVLGKTQSGSAAVKGEADSGIGLHGVSASQAGVKGESTSGSGMEGVSQSGSGLKGTSMSGAAVEGMSTSGSALKGSSMSGSGIEGKSTSGAGVHAESTSGDGVQASSDSAAGVYGESKSGYGVWGYSASEPGVRGSSESGRGVEGIANSQSGVYGESQQLHGVSGISKGVGFGVLGRAEGGVAGVHGRGTADANGVEGRAEASGIGVKGESVSGVAVSGTSTSNSGVEGSSMSSSGVEGESMSGVGVSGISTSNSGVEGNSDSGAGVKGTSKSRRGVLGISESNIGVEGVSTSSRGIQGVSNAEIGVAGFSMSNKGVQGMSTSGTGVLGVSMSGRGVEGQSNTRGGVAGFSQSGVGVGGVSTSGDGIFGESTSGAAGTFGGRLVVTGAVIAGAKFFHIDYPLDPANKYLNHASVESSEMKNIYDGVTELDADGEAIVTLPEWFSVLNRDFRYQLTALGSPAPSLYIAEEVRGNQFRIGGGRPGMKVSWQITGIRDDVWARAHPIQVVEEKPSREQGTYFHPEVYQQPKEKGFLWLDHADLMQQLKETNRAGGQRGTSSMIK